MAASRLSTDSLLQKISYPRSQNLPDNDRNLLTEGRTHKAS
jgi:hypothetical protein